VKKNDPQGRQIDLPNGAPGAPIDRTIRLWKCAVTKLDWHAAHCMFRQFSTKKVSAIEALFSKHREL
jgi:hypothetical protein